MSSLKDRANAKQSAAIAVLSATESLSNASRTQVVSGGNWDKGFDKSWDKGWGKDGGPGLGR